MKSMNNEIEKFTDDLTLYKFFETEPLLKQVLPTFTEYQLYQYSKTLDGNFEDNYFALITSYLLQIQEVSVTNIISSWLTKARVKLNKKDEDYTYRFFILNYIENLSQSKNNELNIIKTTVCTMFPFSKIWEKEGKIVNPFVCIHFEKKLREVLGEKKYDIKDLVRKLRPMRININSGTYIPLEDNTKLYSFQYDKLKDSYTVKEHEVVPGNEKKNNEILLKFEIDILTRTYIQESKQEFTLNEMELVNEILKYSFLFLTDLNYSNQDYKMDLLYMKNGNYDFNEEKIWEKTKSCLDILIEDLRKIKDKKTLEEEEKAKEKEYCEKCVPF